MAHVTPRPSLVPAVLAALLAAGSLTGCGRSSGRGNGSGSGACDPQVQEPLDPASTQHVLSPDVHPTYRTNPPTSGPHRLGNHPTGILSAPIDPPVQVAMLESGAVLLQYRPDLPSGQVATLGKLAGGQVTVAPNPSLPAPVVATAWVFKETCRSVDAAALRRFVKAHGGKGAGHP